MKAPSLFQKKKRRRGSKEVEVCVLAPLATEDPVDQLDGVQEENEEEEEEEMMRISPRSDSPRGQLLLLPCSGHGTGSHSNSSSSNSGQSLQYEWE